MANKKLKAEARKVTGRKVKSLRAKGIVPANIFGKKTKSASIQVDVAEFKKVFEEAGETGIIEISVGTKTHPCLVSNVQVHPVTEEILHVDFREVDLTEKVTATVPIEFVGEAPAEKTGIGIVVQQMNDIDVEALPMDFPENIEVDISILTEVDQAITVADLKYNKTKLTLEAEASEIVANVAEPQKEEEPLPPTEGEAVKGEEVVAEGKGEATEESPHGQEQPSDQE